MPQTTDQLKPCPFCGRKNCDWEGHSPDARAVPLVAEAPREPVAGLTISETPAGPAFEVSLGQGIFSLNLPPGVYPLYVAPPVSLAPMPEEWLKKAMEKKSLLIHRLACLLAGGTAEAFKAADDDFDAHLRTAPLTLSDEQARNEALALSYVLTAWKNVTSQEWDAEHQLLRKVLADASRVLALLASVAPQPEQPNTDSIHLAANRESAVQGLDDAGGVAACETCSGEGTIDERLGGYSFSNPAATCPDCEGTGEGPAGAQEAPHA